MNFVYLFIKFKTNKIKQSEKKYIMKNLDFEKHMEQSLTKNIMQYMSMMN
jgi:hypothetical protein